MTDPISENPNDQFKFADAEDYDDIELAKAQSEIDIANRKMRLEELRAHSELDKMSCSSISSLAGLSEDIVKAKILADIDIANRRMRLEELRADHEMELADRAESFRQSEAARITNLTNLQGYDHWMRKYWRAAAGWAYLIICLFDFVIAPTMFELVPIFTHTEFHPWTSLTLSNGGMMHISFGAILGVAAWSRGQTDLLRTKIVGNKVLNDS